MELGGNKLQSIGAIKIAKSLQNIVHLALTKFGISKNNICEEAAHDIATILSQNTKLVISRWKQLTISRCYKDCKRFTKCFSSHQIYYF